METVFVAMSGGVDSSFAARLLKARGYNVVGVTFELLPPSLVRNIEGNASCSPKAAERAARIAHDLSIPHHILDLRSEFGHHVVDRFVAQYRAGWTPNPCVLCNRYIKFEAFLQKALSLGADRIATGHYATLQETPDGWTLRKGADKTKDQSYFLYPLTKGLLDRVIFPLGGFTKDQVRQRMKDLGPPLTTAKESQDICFIPEGDYRGFLSHFVDLKRGPIYHVDGTHLGSHDGVHLYTVGQRKGLRIPFGQPLYVVEIRTNDNSLVVGPKEYLLRTRILASDVNVLGPPQGKGSGKVRYRQKEEPCSYEVKDTALVVEFQRPVHSVSPGQSIVVYQEDCVVAGGTITASI